MIPAIEADRGCKARTIEYQSLSTYRAEENRNMLVVSAGRGKAAGRRNADVPGIRLPVNVRRLFFLHPDGGGVPGHICRMR